MSLVSFVYNRDFFTVVSDGRAVVDDGLNRGESFSKFRQLNGNTIIGLTGSYKISDEQGNFLFETVVAKCKRFVSEYPIKEATNYIESYILSIPFSDDGSKVMTCLVSLGDVQSQIKETYVLSVSNIPNDEPNLKVLNQEGQYGYAILESAYTSENLDTKKFLMKAIESREVTKRNLLKAQKELNQYVSEHDQSVNENTFQQMLLRK
ncbi:hypothetical protein KIJ00_04015 [Leuconostoc gelidum subsp. aenigmaticum]|uniref:hypothetical protein n=1 Tax=Leuconostoc gelidum TaxID=1244 RepID=UPI001CC4B6CE|nr:hypothetical protein [Leuconostoc gelidum]MBZ6008421.1 hypothetical protein [Leuconostoc gelidum subsp. aenigmaticum]